MTENVKSDFVYFSSITTRWMDNDMFGHVNNVNYYSYFDTVINQFLIERAGFDPLTSQQIGFIVESSCRYVSPISYPDKLIGGLRIGKIGNSSVTYTVGIFKEFANVASAVGNLTHVFVDRDSQRPTPLDATKREAMQQVVLDGCT